MSRKFEILKDYSGEQLVFKTSQEVGGILDANGKEFNESKQDDNGVMGRKVASVPIDVLDQWIKEGIDYRKIKTDPEMRVKFFRRLNSPEWRKLKTYNGHIG